MKIPKFYSRPYLCGEERQLFLSQKQGDSVNNFNRICFKNVGNDTE